VTPAACSFETAAANHLRDALDSTVAERWQWLRQAIAFGAATARSRAVKGLITLGPHGELLWSPLHETLWTREQRLPEPAELATLAGDR
jgi:hypothetical protein